uniref:Uncharacterized protein n=1 Tax=Jaculus jaculus TaxID=51337 RepID=A0A8C5K0F5_JACJA
MAHLRGFAHQHSCVDPEELFTKLDRIGKGSSGEVYKGIDNHTKEVVEAEDEIEDIQQEITVLKHQAMDYHGVLGRWLCIGLAEARPLGGNLYCHHPVGNPEGPGLSALGAQDPPRHQSCQCAALGGG